MELIKCPECGEWYSPSYPRCPFCEEDGDSFRKKKKRGRTHRVGGQRAGQSARGAMIVVLLLVLALLGWYLFGQDIIHGRDAVKEDEPQTETTDKTEAEEPNVPAISTNVEPVTGETTPQTPESTEPVTDDTPDVAPTVEPVEPTPDKTDSSAGQSADVTNARLNRTDFTLSYEGEKFTLKLSGTAETPTWSIDNPNVATIRSDGTVVAVANGNTTVHCKVGSRDLTCKVRVRNTGKTAAAAGTPMTAVTVTPEAPPQPTTTTPVTPTKPETPTATNTPKPTTTDTTTPASGTAHVDASKLSVKTNYGTVLQKDPSSGYPDCTVRLGGDPLSLRIVGTDLKPSSWTSDNTDVVTVDADGKLTPVVKGTAHVTATVGDAKITCIIRVR